MISLTPSVLIVEDEAIVAADLKMRLTMQGYRVVGIASNGATALDLAEMKHPQLVLMDIQLEGGMDGIEAAGLIRQRLHLPVVFLTAFSEDATLERAKQVEPFGYILKPFEDRELKTFIDMAIYKHQAEETIRHLNRLYAFLGQVNQTIVRSRTDEALLQAICRVAVEYGEFLLAWIGKLDPETREVHCVARWGDDQGYLAQIDVRADETPQGQGPTGTAIREGKPSIANHFLDQTRTRPWHDAAMLYNFSASGAFPLYFQGKVWGALNVYSGEADFFREQEISLLDEVAMDVSFALDNLETEHQRQTTLKALQESEQRYIQMVGSVTDYIYTVEIPDGCPASTVHSPGCVAVTGYTPEEYARTPFLWLEMIHPDDRTRVVEHARSAMKGPVKPLEHRILHKDGTERWVRNTLVARCDSDGRAVVCDGLIADITERKQIEKALRHSQADLARAQEIAHMGSWRLEFATHTLTGSDEWYRVHDLDSETFDGRFETFLKQVHPEDQWKHRSAYNEALARRTPVAYEYRVPVKGGGDRYFETSGIHLHLSEEGELLYAYGVTQDVTERKRNEFDRDLLQEQLAQAQKMESIGRLAGGVAHDFNNLLSVILGHGEIMMADLPPASPYRADIEPILKAGERARDLTRQLLAFSRKQVLEVKPLDINKVVLGMCDMIRRLLGEDIRIQTYMEKPVGLVKADLSQLEQVILNLSVNARDAMPNGGILTIETDRVVLDAQYAETHPDTTPGAYVLLSVSDTGEGMDEETQRKIFDPFFTTKEKGRGTGLGLATVYGVVKQHGGSIWVYSEKGKGSIFKIYLPRVDNGFDLPRESVSVNGSVRGQGETVLLMEDDAGVREIASQMLRRLGYRVLVARDARECADLSSAPGPLDLLITDVVMPGTNGREIQQMVVALRPGIKTLFMSGYTENVIAHHGVLDAGVHFISKPFTESSLSRMVRRVLDG
jgi:PAS domain S-box-containing protein